MTDGDFECTTEVKRLLPSLGQGAASPKNNPRMPAKYMMLDNRLREFNTLCSMVSVAALRGRLQVRSCAY